MRHLVIIKDGEAFEQPWSGKANELIELIEPLQPHPVDMPMSLAEPIKRTAYRRFELADKRGRFMAYVYARSFLEVEDWCSRGMPMKCKLLG